MFSSISLNEYQGDTESNSDFKVTLERVIKVSIDQMMGGGGKSKLHVTYP